MLINCVICSDLFVAVDDVCGATCGHLFHYLCLIQWIERSKSCPQCRAKTTEKNIHRVYFNVVTNGASEDPGTLQHKIDSLNFQIRLKDTDIRNVNEKNELLNKQNNGLRDEIKKLEAKVKEQALNVAALKEQAQCLRKQNKDAERAVNECKNLRSHVELLRSVETVVKGTADEVDEMLNNYGVSLDSTTALATYVSVLKKEIHSTSEKRKDLSKKLRESENMLNAASLELKKLQGELNLQANAKKQLEQDLKHSEKEKRSLLKKVKGLEEAIMSPTASNPSESALRRLIAESPAPNDIQRPKLSDPADEQFTPVLTCSSSIKSQMINEKESPYLKVKSSSFGLTPLRPSQTSNLHTSNKFSIFKKARLTTHAGSSTSSFIPETGYDGLGGHSKLDEFPRPSPKAPKHKRHIISSVSKMKMKDVPSKTIKLDVFIDKQQ